MSNGGALIELRAPGDNEWYSALATASDFTDEVGVHEWASVQPILRMSLEGYAGTHYWAPYILSMDTIQYRTGGITGGHAALSFGNISFSPELFTGNMWPPQGAFSFILYHGASKITEGILHLASVTDSSVSYEVYANKYEINILDTAILYRSDGDYTEAEEQPIPLSIGNIAHRNPVRFADAVSGNYVYSVCGLAGTIGADWHVYDDGVNIDSNVDNATATQFELTVSPVGEVTISGTGVLETLSDVFNHSCAKLGLSYNTDDARAVSPVLSWFLTSQQTALGLLDNLAATHTHLFWVDTSTLKLIDCLGFTSTTTVSDGNKIIDSSYSNNPAMASFEATWNERSPVGTIRIQTEDKNRITFTNQFYGEENQVSAYQTDDSEIQTTLNNMVTIYQRMQASVTLPIEGALPEVGERYLIEDTTLHEALNCELYIRGVNYNLSEDKMTLTGDCILS